MKGAIVGFGFIAGKGHLPGYLEDEGIDIVAIADVTPARLKLAEETIPHSPADLSPFADVPGQVEWRTELTRDFLARQGIAPADLSAVVGRGGLLRPLPGGTYRVNERMLADLRTGDEESYQHVGETQHICEGRRFRIRCGAVGVANSLCQRVR